MSADILRRAASLMREIAEAADRGPWVVMKVDDLPIVFDTRAVPEPVVYDQELSAVNAGHIASWHPDVALTVADWLDSVAGAMTSPDDSDAPHAGRSINTVDEDAALTVARAYLGESA